MKIYLSGLIFILPFFSFPWLTNPNSTAKAYLFYFCVLFLLVWAISHVKKLYLDTPLLLWALYILSLSVSTILNNNHVLSWQFVAMLVVTLGFFYLMRVWSRRDNDVTTVLMKTLLCVAVLFALLGLGQGIDYLLNGARAGMLIPYLLPGTWGVRVSGPFGQPNFHALLMVSGLCSFVYVYLKEIWGHTSKWIQGGALLLPFLLWLNFFQTDSRGGQLSLAAVVIVFLWLKTRSSAILKDEHGWQLFTLLAVLGLIAYGLRRLLVFALFDPSIVSGLRVAQSYSITSRINLWFSSLLMAGDHPFFGIGPDNFKIFLPEYQLKALKILHFEYADLGYTRWAHNEYLQVLAEGGIISFAILMVLFSLLFYRVFNNLKVKQDSFSTFAFLALIPFVVQAAFSWPMRLTPLLVFFIAILSSLLPDGRCLEIDLDRCRRGFLLFVCISLLLMGCWSFVSELRVHNLAKNLKDKENIVENFAQFSALVKDPFAENELLTKGITPFVNYVVRENDKALAADVVPFLERAIPLDGSYWQWYNLARVLFVVGEEARSKDAILKCIDLNPLLGSGWAFRHHLDVIVAARNTGRTIESYYHEVSPELDLENARDFLLQHQ